MPPTLRGSLARWNALEHAVDRWASMGAFALALLAVFVFVVLI